MLTQLTIDKVGRIVIPKSLRDELRIEPGDSLEVESSGDEITLRPVGRTCPLIREQGVWVFRTGEPISAAVTDRLLRQIRTERDAVNLGEGE